MLSCRYMAIYCREGSQRASAATKGKGSHDERGCPTDGRIACKQLGLAKDVRIIGLIGLSLGFRVEG